MKLKISKKLTSTFCATLLLLFVFTLSLPILASAANYVPLAAIPGTTNPSDTETEVLGTYLTGMFRVGIAVAGVLAFLMIVLGGFQYLSTDAITGKEEGKERVMRALGGLVLALVSYVVLNTINPKLVALNLDFGTEAKAKDALGRPGDLALEEQNELTAQTKQATNNLLNKSQDLQSKLDDINAAEYMGQISPAEAEIMRTALQPQIDETNRQIATQTEQVSLVQRTNYITNITSGGAGRLNSTNVVNLATAITDNNTQMIKDYLKLTPGQRALYTATATKECRIINTQMSSACNNLKSQPWYVSTSNANKNLCVDSSNNPKTSWCNAPQ